MPPDFKIIVGVLGIVQIRNFITDYFDEGEVIVCMDDDISNIKLTLSKLINLDETSFDLINDKKFTFLVELTSLCNYLQQSDYNLLSFPPTFNEYFLPNKISDSFVVGNYFCLGSFYITKNDKSIRISNFLDDYERTCINLRKYKGVIRYNGLLYKTAMYSNGGIQSDNFNKTGMERNVEKLYKSVVSLLYQYPDLLDVRLKQVKYFTCKIPHLIVKRVPKEKKVLVFPKIAEREFELLLKLLNKIKLKKKPDWKDGKRTNNSYR